MERADTDYRVGPLPHTHIHCMLTAHHIYTCTNTLYDDIRIHTVHAFTDPPTDGLRRQQIVPRLTVTE